MKRARPRIGYVVVIRESRDQVGPVHFSRTAAREFREIEFGQARAVRLAKVKISEVDAK